MKIADKRSGLILSEARTRHYEFLHGTVLDIVRSKHVEEFCVGVSGKPLARRGAYARWCASWEATLDGFVVLDWNRKPDHVRDCEQWLFHRLERHRKYARSTTRRYYPSVAKHLPTQVIYLAWWSPVIMR